MGSHRAPVQAASVRPLATEEGVTSPKRLGGVSRSGHRPGITVHQGARPQGFLFALLVALCVTVASGCASPGMGNKTGEQFDSATRRPMPSFRHLPNYMVRMKCDPFSWTALEYLHAQGIPAHRIVFGWQQMGGLRSHHAAVLFQLNGKYYFMDNDRMTPRLVPGTTDWGCVNRICGDFYTMCWMCNDAHERQAPRKMSDLFAPAPEWLQQLQVGRKN